VREHRAASFRSFRGDGAAGTIVGVLGLAVLLVAGLGLLWAWVVGYTAWVLTHPPRRTYAGAVARGRPGDPSELPQPRAFSAWTFRSRERELPVWEIPGDDPAGPVVILSHGWGDSRIGALVRLEGILPHAAAAVAWDLPGHGDAGGLCALGARESVDLLTLIGTVRRAHAGKPLVLYGWSLGAGISLVAAAGREIDGVVAEAAYRVPITPARNVLLARRLPHRPTLGPALGILRLAFWFWSRGRSAEAGIASGALTLTSAAFDRAAWAAKMDCPLLVLHGECDEICPIEDGRAIAAAAAMGELAVVAQGTHNDLWTHHGAECAVAVSAFVSRAGGRPGGGHG
jgi:pimeloyl-ACP methyl ester carboxylesterase